MKVTKYTRRALLTLQNGKLRVIIRDCMPWVKDPLDKAAYEIHAIMTDTFNNEVMLKEFKSLYENYDFGESFKANYNF